MNCHWYYSLETRCDNFNKKKHPSGVVLDTNDHFDERCLEGEMSKKPFGCLIPNIHTLG